MSAQVMELVEKTMNYTKEYMGASDATLGNIKPDNAAAIVAVQKSTNAPLELQKMAFYQFVEDYIRIFLDIMRADYGIREIGNEDDEQNNNTPSVFDFSIIGNYTLNLNVNVGASAYWSEIMQTQTADNLFQKGVIINPITYLESIPDAYIKNKQKIINEIRQQQEQALAAQSAPVNDVSQSTLQSIPLMNEVENTQIETGTPTV